MWPFLDGRAFYVPVEAMCRVYLGKYVAFISSYPNFIGLDLTRVRGFKIMLFYYKIVQIGPFGTYWSHTKLESGRHVCS